MKVVEFPEEEKRKADPAWMEILAAMDCYSWVKLKLNLEPDPWQKAAMRSRAKKQVFLASRQVGKSLTCTCIALHQSIYVPGSLVLYLAPSQRQAGELMHTSKRLTSLLEEPPELLQDASMAIKFKNGSRILSLPATEGKTRGMTANLVVFDEASRIPDELFYACLPMVAVTRGRILLASTPNGQHGFFWNVWSSPDPEWAKTRVTWRDCPRLTEEEVGKQKALMPDFMARQEWEVEFLETGDGSLFRDSDIRAAREAGAGLRSFFENKGERDPAITPFLAARPDAGVRDPGIRPFLDEGDEIEI